MNFSCLPPFDAKSFLLARSDERFEPLSVQCQITPDFLFLVNVSDVSDRVTHILPARQLRGIFAFSIHVP